MNIPFAKKFACEIIKDHFGELVEKVFQQLVYHGEHHFGDLLRTTGQTPSQLRSCLLVLQQHSAIQAFRPAVDGDAPAATGKVPTFYFALVTNVLQRLRYPRFLVHIRNALGEEAELLLEGLLEHGRLSVKQLLQRAASRTDREEHEVQVSHKPLFVKLVQERFVERIPLVEPVLHPLQSTAQKTVRGQRKKALTEEEVRHQSNEQRVLDVARLNDDRFRLPVSFIADGDSKPNIPTKVLSSSAGAFGKRKRDVVEAVAPVPVPVGDSGDDLLWRVNHEEFLRRFRHELIVAKIGEKLGNQCGVILAAMLDATRRSETSLKSNVSASLSLETITRVVREFKGGEDLTMERIRSSLIQMSSDSTRVVTKESIGSYVINMQNVIDEVRLREVEGMLVQKYGMPGCRIFRLLILKKRLEQKQIGEMAMIPIKDTRELLYNLFKDEYVQLQEISKTADKAPSRTFYLWYVNLNKVMEKVLNNMFHGASNLRQRLQHELNQEQEVLALLETIQQAHLTGAQGAMQPTSLTASQRHQLDRVRRIAAILETSLVRLDVCIMLFNEF